MLNHLRLAEFVDVNHWIQRKLRHSGVTLNCVQIFDCAKVLLTTPPPPSPTCTMLFKGQLHLEKEFLIMRESWRGQDIKLFWRKQ